VGLGLWLGLGAGAAQAEGPGAEPAGPPPLEVPEAEEEPARPPTEEDQGAEAAAALEEEYGVVDDPERLQRLREIIQAIAPQTGEPPAQYVIQILRDDDVNAFSLPGRYLFVTRGLLDFVESDHELAGVLAHEIAHSVHHHHRRQEDRSRRLERRVLIGAGLVALLGSAGLDPAGLIWMGSALQVRTLNRYSRADEDEADRSAVEYLRGTPYNPVGLLTFMERLDRLERRRPALEPGIFQTHPATSERIQTLQARLQALGVALDRRAVTDVACAQIRPVTVRDQEIAELVIRGRVVFQPVAAPPEAALGRAAQAARQLNAQFDRGLHGRQVQVVPDGEVWVVTAGGAEVLRCTPADAAFHQRAAKDLALQAAAEIRRALWEDFVKTNG